MVLDTLEQPNVNIKDVTLPNSERKSIMFDPEKDITPKMWGDMLTEWNKRKDRIDGYEDFFTSLLILFSNKPDLLEIPTDTWDRLRSRALSWYSRGSIITSKYTYKHKLMVPELTNEQMELNTEQEERLISQFNENVSKKYWRNAAEAANNLRILFPEHINNFNLPPEGMEYLLEKMHKEQNHPHDFPEYAAYLKILSAKSISFTNNRINIEMEPENIANKKPLLPERRRF